MLSTLLLRSMPLPGNLPIIADTHNVEFDVCRRMSQESEGWLRRTYFRRQWRFTYAEEKRCSGRVDLLLATSVRDGKLFQTDFGIDRVATIPNGIDTVEFAPSHRLGVPGRILFTGLMSYYPNQQAVSWFLERVFPAVERLVSNVSVVVAGAEPPGWLRRLSSSKIAVTGRVPDIRPFLDEATVVIAPLQIGGGTRVKILEAQALAKPVVSTSIGAEGLDQRHGTTILLADDPRTFARQTAELLSDPALAQRIGWAGCVHARGNFDWNQIGDQLAHLLRDRLGLSLRGGPRLEAGLFRA